METEEVLEKQEVLLKEQTNEPKENELGTQKIGKLIRKFAIPCILSLVVSALYNIVDQIFIGQGVGTIGNTATNIVFPVSVIAAAFSLMVGDGAAAFLSLSLGRKDTKNASKGIASSITLTVILGVLFLIFGFVFKNPLLQIFGVTEGSYTYSNEYMIWILMGLPFAMFTNMMNSVIRADGSPKYAMVSTLVGCLLNMILDPIAIFVLKWGVTGAAVATVVGQLVSCIVSALYIQKFKTITMKKEDFKLNRKVLTKVCSLGVSSFITQISITLVMIVMNHTLGSYGSVSKYGSDIPIAALGIVMKVNQIITSIVVGIAVGAQPIVGYNYGAQKYDRAKKAYSISVRTAIAVTAFATVIFQLCPQVIINLFGQGDEIYNEFAQRCFKEFLIFTVLQGVQISSSIFLQSIGKPMKSAILSLSRQIIFLMPSLIIMPMIWGIDGVLHAGPTADGLAFVLAITLITIEMKNIKKLEVQKNG